MVSGTIAGDHTIYAVHHMPEFAYTARLVWNVMGNYGYKEGAHKNSDEWDVTFGLAGAFYHEEPTVGAGTEDKVMMGNADIGFKYKRLSFQSEVFYRHSDASAAASAVKDFGYYAQLGYFFVPEHFEMAVRMSSLFDDTSNSGNASIFNNGSLTSLGGNFDGVDEGSDADNEHEFSLVGSYYFSGTPIKLQAQYSFMLDGVAGTDDIVNHIGMIQAQIEI